MAKRLDPRKLLVAMDALDNPIENMCRHFDSYLEFYENSDSSKGKAIFNHSQHISTIKLRNELGGVRAAIHCDEFINSVWATLDAWGMNRRGAKLESLDHFIFRLRKYEQDIVNLERWIISDIPDNPWIANELRRIIYKLKLSSKGRQVVAGSKALHHLLPKLLPPIDGTYTCKFFGVSGPDGPKQFPNIIRGFGSISHCIADKYGGDYLSNLIDKTDWSTSETKLIDNAIAGRQMFIASSLH